MPDKQNASDKKIEDSWDKKPQSLVKRQKGKVALIIPHNRIVIEYGNGLGAEIKYSEEKHKNVKIGDFLEI